MKWIRRKPSLRAQVGVVIACAIILLAIGAWIIATPNDNASTAWQTMLKQMTGRPGYYMLESIPTCYVTRVDGEMQILGDGTLPSEAVWEEQREHLYLYNLSRDPSGILAPTTMNIRHRLYKPTIHVGSHPSVFQAFSRRWRLGLTPDENGRIAIDPRLERLVGFEESRPIWSGYAVNAVALLACCGLVWSIRWTPRQIRHLIRRRRYLRVLCPLCRYDVRATPGKCPECGWGHEVGADEADAD